MPERSFGRTIRFRRTKMGLSQAKLGELVGRSPSTIRSWERDNSLPNDKSVVEALAAVLDIDRDLLYSKTGIEAVPQETSPTVEQALATLTPEPEEIVVDIDEVDEPEGDAEMEVEDQTAAVAEPLDAESDAGMAEAEDTAEPPEDEDVHPDSPETATPRQSATPTPSPGYVALKDNLVFTPAVPRVVEPSYVEDGQQRQVYRIRALATTVFVVALVVVMLWAASNAWDSFTGWWSDFFGNLRL